MSSHASHDYLDHADAAVNAARARSAVLWIVGSLASAAVAWFGPRLSGMTMTLHLLGFLLAGVIVAARSIAHRGPTLVTAVLVLGASSFGLWAPRLFHFVDVSLADRIAALTDIDVIASQAATVPISILIAGFISSLLLFLGTGSPAVLATTIAATVAASVVPISPLEPDLSMAIAGALWQTAVTTALCRWSVQMAMRASGACCPSCGYDVRGLTSPVCPHCSETLVIACPLNTRADRIDQGITFRRVG